MPPGVVGRGGEIGSGSFYGHHQGDSTITHSRSEDSRNPPPILRTDLDPTGRIGDEGYDEFSAKVRSEMKRVQVDLRAGIVQPRQHQHQHQHQHQAFSKGSTRPSPPVAAAGNERRPMSAAPPYPNGAASNWAQGGVLPNHGQRSTIERNALFEQDHRSITERNMYLEQELVRYERQCASDLDRNIRQGERTQVMEQELSAKDSEIADLKRHIRTLQQAKDDEVSSVKDKLAQQHKHDMSEVEKEYKGAFEEAVAENEMLQKELASSHEHSRAAMHELREQSEEVQILREEHETMKCALEEAVAENEILQKELASSHEHSRAATSELREQSEEVHILREEHENMGKMRDIAERDVELSQRDIVELEVKMGSMTKERMRLETVYDDMKKNYQTLLEDKIQCERVKEDLMQELDVVSAENVEINKGLKGELDCLSEENDVMKTRLALLDEVTEALEIALAEKEDIVVQCDVFQREVDALQSTKESMADALERELQATKRSMEQALECALADKDSVVEKYNELSREHTILQSTKDSESHVTKMITKQRDKMSAMMDKYQAELDQLRSVNVDILRERDDLKEELICVLETASVYQD